MQSKNRKNLERLSLFSHFSGVISIFLGLLVVFLNIMNRNLNSAQIGILIFINGYAFVKISAQITAVIRTEKDL